jgi:outer membrane lipoprotein-sorting protein
MTRRALLAVALAALAVSAGCGSLPSLGGGDTAPSPPDEDVAAAFDDIETIQATQVSRLESGNTTNRTRARTTIRLGDTVQQFTRVLAPDDRAGNVQAVNETRVVIYDAGENNVTVVPRTDTTRVESGEYYASIVAAARNDSTVSPPSQGVSPLPVVPRTSTPGQSTAGDIEGFTVEYLGTDEVAGRTTHGFRLTPASEGAVNVTRTYWLDSEFYYPLRTTYTGEFGNETYHGENHLENVTFNAEVAESTFDWQPPSDATVDDVDLSTERYESLAALRDGTDIAIPDPDLPEGYAFQRAQTYNSNFSQLSVAYTGDDGARLVVSKVLDPATNGSGLLDEGESVTVAGNDGVYLVNSQASLVTWRCDGVQYTVTATALEKGALLDVAASVACE